MTRPSQRRVEFGFEQSFDEPRMRVLTPIFKQIEPIVKVKTPLSGGSGGKIIFALQSATMEV